MIDLDSENAGGLALVVGYLLVLGVFYRDPVGALGAATAGVQSLVYFLVLPVGGLLAGLYAVLGGPYSGAPVFLLGTYLGIVGLALTVGNLLASTGAGILLAMGLVLVVLSLVALVTSLLSLFGSFRIRPSSTPPE